VLLRNLEQWLRDAAHMELAWRRHADLEPLAVLVLLLLAAGGPRHLRLADNASLHISLVRADNDGSLGEVFPQLGHRPDPMVGRRVSGLDKALRDLVACGSLVPSSAGRWRSSTAASDACKLELATKPPAFRERIRKIANCWKTLAQDEAVRRGRLMRAG
jgi:hypothetical protein